MKILLENEKCRCAYSIWPRKLCRVILAHLMLLAKVIGNFRGHDINRHRRIELLELRGTCLGAVLAHIRLGEIEVRAQIGELARGGLLQGH